MIPSWLKVGRAALTLTGVLLLSGCPKTGATMDAAGAGMDAGVIDAGGGVTSTAQSMGLLPAGAGTLTVQYSVTNHLGQSIFVVDGPRMPYVAVADTNHAELYYDVPQVKDDIGLFPPPTLVEVPAGTTRTVMAKIPYPLQPSDHFHTPGAAKTTGAPLNLRIVQGYATTKFSFNSASPTIYPDFMKWQQLLTTPSVSISDH